jgi:hypothetical protein
MSVPAQRGAFIFALKVGKSDPAASPDWLTHKASDINLGVVQDQRTFPLEVGGDLTPNGGYKAGAFVAGGVSLQPRINGDAFPTLLYGLLGQDTVEDPVDDDDGITHTFSMAPDQTFLPWLDIRKYIPSGPGGTALGEEGLDCVVQSMRLTVPQNGIVQARFDFVGRIPRLVRGATGAGWTSGLTYDDDESVPVSCETTGSVELPSGTALPIQNLVVQFSNNTTTPQQELVIGSPHPDDFVVLSRAATIQATLKWDTPDVYERIVQLETAASAWSSRPWFTSFKAVVNSSKAAGAEAEGMFGMTLRAARVMWAVSGAPVLAGGDVLLLPITGTIMTPAPGDTDPYFAIDLVNEQEDAYASPVHPPPP